MRRVSEWLMIAVALASPALATLTAPATASAESMWSYNVNAPQVTLGTMTEYECDPDYGCYPVAWTSPEVEGWWQENWLGNPTSDAEIATVCMDGQIQNPGVPSLDINDVFKVRTSSGTQVWSGGVASVSSCVLQDPSYEYYQGWGYPYTQLYYPGSVTSLTVVAYTTDNMVVPESESVTYSFSH